MEDMKSKLIAAIDEAAWCSLVSWRRPRTLAVRQRRDHRTKSAVAAILEAIGVEAHIIYLSIEEVKRGGRGVSAGLVKIFEDASGSLSAIDLEGGRPVRAEFEPYRDDEGRPLARHRPRDDEWF
jgi:hypothetical protein